MGKLIDLTGQRFGRLIVLEKHGISKHGQSAQWLCQCDCGNTKIVFGDRLKSDTTLSCGCLVKEVAKRTGKAKTLHNKYEVHEDYVVMYANNTNRPFYIDTEDLEKVKEFTWNENKRGYIVRTNSRNNLHQFVKGKAPQGMVIDHQDRNKLNNRKSNLVFKSQADNAINRSTNKNNVFGVAGVHKGHSEEFPYCVTLGAGGRLFKGKYTTLHNAIIARLQAEKKFLGEKAPQKHLFKEYGI